MVVAGTRERAARTLTRSDLRPEIDARPPRLPGSCLNISPSRCSRHQRPVLFPAPPVGNNLRNQLNREGRGETLPGAGGGSVGGSVGSR